MFEFKSFLTKNFLEIDLISLLSEFLYFLYVSLSMLMFHPTQQESIQSFPIHLKSCIYSGTKKFLLDCVIVNIPQY